MHKSEEKHIFAVYSADLFVRQPAHVNALVVINDQEIVHRIVTVLRMQVGQELLLFDDKNQYQCSLSEIKKNKAITVHILSIVPNVKPKHEIYFMLPLLKKEALEEAVYALTEIGVTSIHLVITIKSQKSLSDKEIARLHKIKIAAAEQSKNMNLPIITKPVSLEQLCSDFKGAKIPAVLFDPAGVPAFEFISELKKQKPSKVIATIGPEGGLTSAEVQMLIKAGFTLCKLTNTVLRAMQAAAVGAGLLASAL